MARTAVNLEEALGQEAPAPELAAQGGPVSEPLRSPLKMTVTAPMGLNLRSGPGAEFDVAAVLPDGAEVTVWETWADGRGAQGWFEFHIPGWAYVFTGEQAGWASRLYLAPKPPEEIT